MAALRVRPCGAARILDSVRAFACSALLMAGGSLAWAPNTLLAQSAAPRYALHIPAQRLGTALRALSRATGQNIQYAPGLVAERSAPALEGHLTLEEALRQLLSLTDLSYQIDSTGTLHVTRSAVDNEGGVGHPQNEKLPEILVQGSRVLNIDLTRTEDDIQPYYVFDAQTLQQSGAANVEDFLKSRLSMNTEIADATQLQSAGGNNNNGGLPANNAINLRGLGSNETLILVDGRRLPSVTTATGFGSSGQADINGIPIAAIERIEVLPSSASAIYGGAAMGGVVNIILKKNYSGADLGLDFDNSFAGNSQHRTVYGSIGTTLFDGATRVMLSASYADGDPLLLGDRANIIERNIALINQRSPGYLFGYQTPFQGSTTNITSADGSNLVLLNGTSLNSPYTYIPPGFAAGGNLTAALIANAGKQNFNLPDTTGFDGLQYQLAGVPTRESVNLDVRQRVTDRIEVFVDYSLYGNAYSSVFNELSGFPLSSAFFTLPSIPAGAPGNPFQNNINITLPSADGGPATSNSVDRRVTAGVVTRLWGDWSGELDWTWAENSHWWRSFYPDENAIDAAVVAGTLNPFVDTLAHPLNLSQYDGSEGESAGGTVNDVLFRLAGSLGSLPGGRPTLTVGGEHRYEGTENENASFGIYPNFPQDDFYGTYFGQSESVSDGYVEALVPLVGSDNQVPGIDSLKVQAATRLEHYQVYVHQGETFNGATVPPVAQQTNYDALNWTAGLEYRPIHSLTLRASYATAFLPPEAADLLYAPTNYGVPVTITDPKNGETYQVQEYQSGGPWIRPETAKTIDVGLIWEPEFRLLDGLRVNLETYHIDQPNQIYRYPTAQFIVDNPPYPGWVIRDPTTGLITQVDAYEFNAVDSKTSGFDLGFDYPLQTLVGTFALHAQGTYVARDLRQSVPDTPYYEFAGHPNDGGEVKSKINATLTWSRGGWNAGWTAVYLGPYWQVGAPNAPTAGCGGPYLPNFCAAPIIAAQGGDKVASQIYHDLFAGYAFADKPSSNAVTRDILSNLKLQLSIHNVFNAVPPLDAFYYPYFTSPFGSLRLRSYELSVRKAF